MGIINVKRTKEGLTDLGAGTKLAAHGAKEVFVGTIGFMIGGVATKAAQITKGTAKGLIAGITNKTEMNVKNAKAQKGNA